MDRRAIFEAIDNRRPFSLVIFNEDGTLQAVIPFHTEELRRADAS
jgi:hypothetical protein